MSGQISANRSLAVLLGWTGLPLARGRRSVRISTNHPNTPSRQRHPPPDGAVDPNTLIATSAASATRRWNAELGVLFHLVCVALVGTMIIAIFFGTGLYSLAHPTEQRSPEYGLSGGKESGSTAVSLGAPSPSMPDPAQPRQTSAPQDQATQPDVNAKAFGSPRESVVSAPGQDGAISAVKRPRNASTELLTGTVTEAPDAMTWIVGDQTLHLWGIRPAALNQNTSFSDFVNWVRAQGPVKCRRQARSDRFQCLTATREDIAKAALSAGVARAADGATVGYRDAEAQARRESKGVWAKP